MSLAALTDAQWCVLDVLMRARSQGIGRINRMELLGNYTVPTALRAHLVWAALTMPTEFVTWTGQHDFAITEMGAAVFNLRVGRDVLGGEVLESEPTTAADAVIALPDLSRLH